MSEKKTLQEKQSVFLHLYLSWKMELRLHQLTDETSEPIFSSFVLRLTLATEDGKKV